MKTSILVVLIVLSSILAGCSIARENPPAASVARENPQAAPTVTKENPPAAPTSVPESQAQSAQDAGLSRIDEQGAVSVVVTPVDLETMGANLEFSVTLDTHSIDLGMDLAELAWLSTDSGMSVQALSWDAPRGGHHVQGTLIFPAESNGAPLLAGVTKLTMTIKALDGADRVFTWEISP